MDPVVSKLSTTLPDSSRSDIGGQAAKSGASKFDQISSQLKDKAVSDASSAEPTSLANPASPAHSPAASVDTSMDRMQRDVVAAPDRVHKSLAISQHHLARLRERVESTPEATSMQGLQSRLASIEHQYTRLDSAVNAMPQNASPQQWMAMQQQVYSMNENIGVLSKMIGQAASGVKSILQTQV
jgi:hypothetical protein